MGKGRRMGVLEAPMADKRCSGVWEGDRWGEQPGPALSAAPPPVKDSEMPNACENVMVL